MSAIRTRLTGLWLLPCLFLSCAKQNTPPGAASLTVVNTVVGCAYLYTNFAGAQSTGYAHTNIIEYNKYNSNYNQFNHYSGTQPLSLYRYPDTTTKDKPVFDLVLDLPVASIHTLFLTGTFNAPDTVYTAESFPYYVPGDSAMGFRFINLSPGSAPITVNIAGNPHGTAASSLGFKQYTGFKRYPVTLTTADYTFEIRDAASDALIATYTTSGINNPGTAFPNPWLYHNCTLALTGKPGATGSEAQTAFLITH